MSSAKLIRWSGLISLSAGVLYALAAFLHPVGEDLAAVTSPKWVPAHLVYWVSVILMQLGLVGLYARQVEKAGWLWTRLYPVWRRDDACRCVTPVVGFIADHRSIVLYDLGSATV